MRASEGIKDWMKRWEGLRLSSYRCPAGVWTIGYGHTDGVKVGQYISTAMANELFEQDLAKVETQLQALMQKSNVKLNQGQYDALCSFVFNLGIGNLKSSTLWRKVKANPADPSIRDEFGRWVYSNHVRIDGLVKRREMEARFWERGM